MGEDDPLDIVDWVVVLLSRVTNSGLPVMVLIEDFHSADEMLVELVQKLLGLDRPIMVITATWPDKVKSIKGLANLLNLHRNKGTVHRVRHDRETAPPFQKGAGLRDLEENARAAIVRGYFPNATETTTKALAVRYANPLVLETICQLPRYQAWRDNASEEFGVSSQEISELPELLEDVYREFWNQLPEDTKKWLSIAWMITPKNIHPEGGAGENTWIHRLLCDVVNQLALVTGNGPFSTLDCDPPTLGWVRVRGDGDLRAFTEPEMAHIIGHDGFRLLNRHLIDAQQTILEALAGAVTSKDYQESITGARTVLALHYREFLRDSHAVEAIDTLLSRLQSTPRELSERVRLYKRFTELDHSGVSFQRVFNIHHLGALAIGDAGRPNRAVIICRELLDAQQRILGADHPNTLRTRGNLASLLGEAGQVEEASAQFRELLDAQQRILGADHPNTLGTRGNLASLVGKAGRVEEASAQFRELLEDQQRILGADHPAVFLMRNNLAFLVGEAGRVEDAIAEFRDLLEDRVRVLGADHPDTLSTRNNLAYWLGEAGRVEDASAQYRELLDDQQHLLGADHPDTLSTRNNLAYRLGEAGRVEDAIAQYRELLDDQQHLLGADHPDTLSTRNNLAYWLGEAGRVEDAIAQYRDLLEDRVRVLGADHPDTLSTRNNLAYWLGEAGRVEDAIAQYRDLLEDRVRVLGADHPDTLSTRNNLAYWLGEAGTG